ncbi:MAG: peptidylprolyl isomerase [Patescibacteria group bacterium]
MQHKQQQVQREPRQEAKTTEDFNKNIKDLALVILIVAVAGWALFKYDSRNDGGANNQSNQSKEENMPEKITAEKAYTITDPGLQIKPPTDEEAQKYDADAEVKTVVLETTKGIIKVQLYPKDAPFTVASFMKLIDKGLYNGLIFHRVIDGFMIQGGDPSGNGTGGPGYKFIDELNPETASYKEGYKKGALAMANSGPNTNGSQFFIMLEDYQLPKNYTIFGKVTVGQEVVDTIGKVAVSKDPATENRPLTDVKIKRVYLEDVK